MIDGIDPVLFFRRRERQGGIRFGYNFASFDSVNMAAQKPDNTVDQHTDVSPQYPVSYTKVATSTASL